MNKLLENDEGILLHAHAGKDGGKIADVFTLSAGLVRIYVGKTVLERCGSGGMVSSVHCVERWREFFHVPV